MFAFVLLAIIASCLSLFVSICFDLCQFVFICVFVFHFVLVFCLLIRNVVVVSNNSKVYK